MTLLLYGNDNKIIWKLKLAKQSNILLKNESVNTRGNWFYQV